MLQSQDLNACRETTRGYTHAKEQPQDAAARQRPPVHSAERPQSPPNLQVPPHWAETCRSQLESPDRGSCGGKPAGTQALAGVPKW
ncbi:Hypothetical predicted protein, partial [Marmota monax]